MCELQNVHVWRVSTLEAVLFSCIVSAMRAIVGYPESEMIDIYPSSYALDGRHSNFNNCMHQ